MEVIGVIAGVVGAIAAVLQLFQNAKSSRTPAPPQNQNPTSAAAPIPKPPTPTPPRSIRGTLLILVGSLVLIVYYIWPVAPVLATLANWNLAIGGVLIVAGFIVHHRRRQD
ncbi:cell division protein CrgA [Microbispora bryophytorum]|uniref:cell division protein CrgA n=1 Tax=Microbispora bryophytorum TaxID=1460882 RepID=UPI0033EFAFF7